VKSVRFVGGGEVGRWCRAKKYPPSRGVLATFASKAGQSYGVFAVGVGVFLGVLRGSLCGGQGGGWVFLRTFAVWPLHKSVV
jgi:hypothetical protein